jgi:hypothetical protein
MPCELFDISIFSQCGLRAAAGILFHRYFTYRPVARLRIIIACQTSVDYGLSLLSEIMPNAFITLIIELSNGRC